MTSVMFSEQELTDEKPGNMPTLSGGPSLSPVDGQMIATWLRARMASLELAIKHQQKTDMPDVVIKRGKDLLASYKVILHVVIESTVAAISEDDNPLAKIAAPMTKENSGG